MTVHEYIIRKGAGRHLRSNCAAFIASLDAGKSWRVTVQPFRKKRTTSQNSLLWAWYTRVRDSIESDTGTDKDTIHDFFKPKFLTLKAFEVNGHWSERRSTKDLNTAEMSEFMDKVYHFCREEWGMILPTPEAWVECGGDMGLLRERIAQPAKEN